MKSTLLVFAALIYVTNCVAQEKNNIWFLYPNLTIDFRNLPLKITPQDHKLKAFGEGSTIICDSVGNLWFYTDGIDVFNKEHEVMPNGSNIINRKSSSAQQSIVLKSASNANIFYVFSLSDMNGDLFLNTIDMEGNNKLGEVVYGSLTKVGTNFTEQMTTFPHPCGGIWVIVRDKSLTTFKSIHFENGVVKKIVTTEIGSSFLETPSTGGAAGTLSINSSQKLISCLIDGLLEIFDFDSYNGRINNGYILLRSSVSSRFRLGAAMISNDGNYLYVPYEGITGHWVYQLNISKNTPSDMVSSVRKFRIPTELIAPNKTMFLSSLKTGPDSNIYFTSPAINYGLGVIRYISESDTFIYEPQGLKSDYKFIDKSLPASLIYENPTKTNFLPSDTSICASISITPNITYDSLQWSTGSTNNTISIINQGLYSVKLYKEGCEYYDTIRISTLATTTQIKTITICSGTSYAHTDGRQYAIGDTLIETKLGQLGACDTTVYSVVTAIPVPILAKEVTTCEGTLYTHIDGKTYPIGASIAGTIFGQLGACDTPIVYTVKGVPSPQLVLSGPNEVCFEGKATLMASKHKSYKWSTGAETQAISVGPGRYSLEVNDTLNCSNSSSITITQRPIWSVAIPDTVEINPDQSFALTIAGDITRIIDLEFIPSLPISIKFNSPTILISKISESTNVTLLIKDNIGCTIEKILFLRLLEENFIFTPNTVSLSASNNINNTWKPSIGKSLMLKEVSIYDRLGNKVFFSQSANTSWDCRINGTPVSDGLYVFTMRLEDKKGATLVKQGEIIVLR